MVEYVPVSRLNEQDDNRFFGTSVAGIDTSFLSTYQIKLVDGRIFEGSERMAFRLENKQESILVLVNEEFLRRLDIKESKNALKEKLQFWWGPDMRYAEIIGVVEDHHQESLKQGIGPVMYMQPQWPGWKYFSARLAPGDLKSTLAAMESVYAKSFPDHPFSYFFLDEFFDHQYNDDVQFGKIFNAFTFLAIIVTCLGLIGLSIFSVSQRTKEVGIRKALGASAPTILFIFSKDFLRVLLISYFFTAPVIWWGSHQWLQHFSFRTPLVWQMFALPPIALVFITFITITIVSIRAAIEAPVKALRQE